VVPQVRTFGATVRSDELTAHQGGRSLVSKLGEGGSATENSSGAAAVRLEHVTKQYKSMVAVDDLSLELAPGEFFALLGPSGCGKTTTLRMVGGFDQPTSGKIFLGGDDITWTPPYKRNVNTVFQSYALFPHLSVFDNVAFGLRRKGTDKREISQLVEEHLDLLGLGGFGPRPATQLSGGQQQRVALARALVNRPKVLLLDEPMGALDAKIRKTMQLELKRIQREVGITFLYVTHDQDEAMALGDRLAVMHGGRYEDLGEPQRVYDQPATQFVAQFLGACNLLAVTPDHDRLCLPDGSVVGARLGAMASTPSLIRQVGVRPEKMQLKRVEHVDASSSSSTVNRVYAAVDSVVYLGATSEYELTSSWGAHLHVVAQNIDDADRLRPGDRVAATWLVEHGFALPADNATVTPVEEPPIEAKEASSVN
jgi:spermidine/putrescine transport system ATP-binding protein